MIGLAKNVDTILIVLLLDVFWVYHAEPFTDVILEMAGCRPLLCGTGEWVWEHLLA